MSKTKIAVIFGGCSSEYNISLQSAFSVIKHINTEEYQVILLGITPDGEWYVFSGEIEKISNDTWNNQKDCMRAIISPDRETKGVLVFAKDEIKKIHLDAAMPMLHGKNGEDGTIQGLLQLAGIPIIGCNTLASALCMDKDKAHKIVDLAGIRVPDAFTIQRKDDIEVTQSKAESMGYPLFVKPVNAGSSLGITMVSSSKELPLAIELAFEHDDRVIIEECIIGFEVGCAIIGGDELIVSTVDEIELSSGFFDYNEKYNRVTSAIHVPARIEEDKKEEVREAAKVIYKALGCSGFARVDMFLTTTGEIVFNEVNTIPGFTVQSRYPNMLKAIGLTFEQIVDGIIKQAVSA